MAVLYDLGAEGGISKRWDSKNSKLLFPEMEIVAFDLDETKLSREKNRTNLVLIDKIISDSESIKDFIYSTTLKSSLYPFNKDYYYLQHEKYHALDKILKVETTTLSKLIKEEQIPPADIIKMDIQGAELSALRGLGQYLNNVNVLELEVEFLPIYQNQPTFVDLHAFLLASGFHFGLPCRRHF